jgi:ABC-type glycerol-3-phosphate transport system substrate-binding protein
LLAAAGTVLLFSGGCRSQSGERTRDGRIVIDYWEKWTGFEADAMKAVVDKYNQSQNKIFVNYLSISQIDRKLLLAAAGGNPPDVAGFWSHRMVVYAEKGALIPLDSLMERDGISLDAYIPSMAEQCRYRGFVWGLPTTPMSLALHYNKALFREAGLDPDRPPRTIAELDDYAEKLTRFDDDGTIVQLGFSPTDPGWWNDRWVYWFGGKLLEDGTVIADSPQGIECFKWIQSYPERYGVDALQRMRTPPSEFATAQNLFIGGKLAMQLQGVWMGNFISRYNPDLEWAAAPFPAVSEDLADTTLVECDTLVIPKGASHVEEAWDFIKFVQQRKNMELLCMGQQKFSPLIDVSDAFYENHPNPYIRVFRRLAESERAYTIPTMPVWDQYAAELFQAFEQVWTLKMTPEDALTRVVARIQPKLDKALAQWERVKDERLAQWRQHQ